MAGRVRRVTLAVVMPLIKGQEEGRIPGQLGGHIDLVGIDRHMHQAAAKVE